jgi:hypothetical protein
MAHDLTALIDAADRRLFDATKGEGAVHDAARVIAALRSLAAEHAPARFVPPGGCNPIRCGECGGDPGDGYHPGDEDIGPEFGYHRCGRRAVENVCGTCYDHEFREHEYQGWPCHIAGLIITALTGGE